MGTIIKIIVLAALFFIGFLYFTTGETDSKTVGKDIGESLKDGSVFLIDNTSGFIEGIKEGVE